MACRLRGCQVVGRGGRSMGCGQRPQDRRAGHRMHGRGGTGCGCHCFVLKAHAVAQSP